jgi:hypothetical protein
MKVAVLSESPVDEAAIRILVGGLLSRQIQPITSLRTQPGWSSVFQYLPDVLKHLHYHTDAEALVVVVDSDNSPVHQQTHDQPGAASGKCRLCRLREIVAKTQTQLGPVSGRTPVKTAIGLAVPAIEAWYRCGVDPHISEAALLQRHDAGTRALRNLLKREVYGTDRPSREIAVRRATEEATRLSQDLDTFESLFPNGFGPLARDVRGW